MTDELDPDEVLKWLQQHRSRPMYYVEERGKAVPATMMQWARMFEDVNNRRVAEAQVGDVWVSTVFLGMDHALIGPPLLYETMSFDPQGELLDDGFERYTTRWEACEGHQRIVDLWLAKRKAS